jgi:hypothetical protein
MSLYIYSLQGRFRGHHESIPGINGKAVGREVLVPGLMEGSRRVNEPEFLVGG